jgi:hypothetical protein
MRTYKVGIIGHRSQRFKDADEVRRLCISTALLLVDQYLPNKLCINTTAAPGAGQWAGEACLKYGIEHCIFLPCPPEIYTSEWYDDQKAMFDSQVGDCCGMTVYEKENSRESVFGAIRGLVDNSDFVVCFWEGTKYGLTFEAIKYAVENSKIVLDAMDNLSMITKKELRQTKVNEGAPCDVPVKRITFAGEG